MAYFNKQTSTKDQELDELFSALSVTSNDGNYIAQNHKKDFDKIHSALEARAKYLAKRKRTHKRKHLPNRQDNRDEKEANLQPEGIREFFRSTLDLPGLLANFLREATTTTMHITNNIEITYSAMSRLRREINSKKFKLTALSMAALTGLGWTLQTPTISTVILDILKFLLSTLSSFILITAEQIISAAQDIIVREEPFLPAQLLEGDYEGLQPQAFRPEDLLIGDYLPMIAGVVSLMGTAIIGQTVIATPALLKNVKSFGEIGRATQGIKQLAENSMNLVTWIFDSLKTVLCEYKGKTLVDTSSICKEIGISNTFMAEVESLLDPMLFDTHMMDKHYKRKLGDARYRLIQFTGSRGSKADPLLRQHIISKITQLTKILSENMQRFVGLGGQMRQVPFVVQLVGEPGCGKSTVMTPVTNFLLTEEGCGRVMENTNVSTMTGVNKYWDGYRGEVGLVIDDAFMTRGSTPGESEYTRFISLVSCVSMIIPKADLNSKGMTADAIKLVLLSSNCEKPSACEINNSEAMLRRRHLVFLTKLNPGTDGRIDPENDRCRFVRKNPITGDFMGNVLTFTEMVKLCSENFKSHLDEQEKLVGASTLPKDLLTRMDLPPPIRPDVEDGWDFEVFDSVVPPSAAEMDDFEKTKKRTVMEIARELKSLQALAPQGVTFRKDPDFLDMESPSENFGIRIPLYDIRPTIDQKELKYFYYSKALCCASQDFNVPVNWFPHSEFFDEYTYCNATRTFSTASMQWEVFNSDVPFENLTHEQRCMFDDAVELGLLLPPRMVYDQLPDHSGISRHWEAFRRQERAFKWDDRNQGLQCVTDAYRDIRNLMPIQDRTGRTAHSATVYMNSKDFYNNNFATQDYDIVQGWAEPLEPQSLSDYFKWDTIGERIDLAVNGLLTLSGIFLAIKLFQVVKNFTRASKILVPRLNYDAKTLDQFINSAPEAYRGQLLEAISQVAVQIEKEQTIVAQALVYDGSIKTNKQVRITPEGIVYDGSATTAKKMAMTVQSLFEANGIKTRSSRDLVDLMCPQGVDENFSAKRLAVMRNTVTFHTPASGEAPAVYGIALRNTDILVPQHFLSSVPYGAEFTLRHGSRDVNVRMEPGMLHKGGELGTSDWAILRLPNSINQFKDIVHTLIRESCISMLDSNAPIVLQRGLHSELTHATIDIQRRVIEDKDEQGNTFERFIARGLTYHLPTAKGDCGAGILLNNNTVDGILCGIHVAGNSKRCMAQIVTREMVEDLLDQMDPVVFHKESYDHMTPFIMTEIESEIEEKKKIQNGQHLPAWGLVPNAFSSVPAAKSRIKKSMITNELEMEDEPFFTTKRATPTFSLEDPRVDEEVRAAGIKPMSIALNKYNDAPHTFPIHAAEVAFLTICTVLSTIQPKNVTKRLLTFAETLNGIPGFMIGIDVKTSVGFPYVKLTRGAKGKSALLKDENDAYRTGKQAHYVLNTDQNGPMFQGKLLSSYFMDRYTEVDKNITQGIIPTYFAYENMKDELVSEKKIKNAKVRTFECLPLEISLLTRKYFGVFMGAMQQHCVEEPISVGINPTSLDWTSLFQRLTKFGEDSIIAGDYANWDGKLMADVILKCVRAINQWYGDSEENQNARMALAISFIHTDILVLNTLVRKRSGMPSGVPVTAPLNSLCNWFYILAAVVDMLEQQDFETQTGEKITPQFLIDNMEIAVYGDDHAIALAAILRRYINFQKFVNYFKNIGITYTDSQKREHVDFEFENIFQITYLKRRFLRDAAAPRFIRAPLDLNSITDMIYWTKVSPAVPDMDVYKSRVKDFEDSLAQHEEATYDCYVKIYNKAVETVHQNNPKFIKNFPKILTPYSYHAHYFLKERGVAVYSEPK